MFRASPVLQAPMWKLEHHSNDNFFISVYIYRIQPCYRIQHTIYTYVYLTHNCTYTHTYPQNDRKDWDTHGRFTAFGTQDMTQHRLLFHFCLGNTQYAQRPSELKYLGPQKILLSNLAGKFSWNQVCYLRESRCLSTVEGLTRKPGGMLRVWEQKAPLNTGPHWLSHPQ